MVDAEKKFLDSRSIRKATLQESQKRRRDNRRQYDRDATEEHSNVWSQFQARSESFRAFVESLNHETFVTASQRHASWDEVKERYDDLEKVDSSVLPSAHVRMMNEEMKGLSKEMKEVREAVLYPTERFVFKRYHEWKAKFGSQPLMERDVLENRNEKEAETEIEHYRLDKILEDRCNETILVEENHDSEENGCLRIKNLVGCKVILKAKYDTFHIKCLKNCTIESHAETSSSVFIHDCSDSIIIAAAKQFRIHDSERVEFHVHSQSPPIIEQCRNLKFWGDFEKVTNVVVDFENKFRDVKDFNWLNIAEKSPNFQIEEN